MLAHEIAHEDLGHPGKAQVIGAGLSLGAALLERLIPGIGTIAPIAGTLISNNYTRPLELEADRHAVTLLERAGYSRHTLVDTLAWLKRRSGNSGGGILSSHPAISERIQALNSLRQAISHCRASRRAAEWQRVKISIGRYLFPAKAFASSTKLVNRERFFLASSLLLLLGKGDDVNEKNPRE